MRAAAKERDQRGQVSTKVAYMTYIRPFLEYTSIWDPYYWDQIHKVEMVQHRAARSVINHIKHSVTQMLQSLQWKSLHERLALCTRSPTGILPPHRNHYTSSLPHVPPEGILDITSNAAEPHVS